MSETMWTWSRCLNLVEDAADGKLNPDAQAIAQTGLEIVALLVRKNRDYGGSAWRRPILAPECDEGTALRCRASDKIERLRRLLGGDQPMVSDETINDTIADLAGYLILDLARPRGGEAK